MFRKLMHNTVAAAGFAALLLVGACASNRNVADDTDRSDTVQQVTESTSVAPAPGPALVDKDGNVYSSSSAGGVGNASTVGNNTNVNIVPEKSTATVTELNTSTEPMTSSTTVDTTTSTTYETPVTTTPTVTTTETTTTTVPMTSSVQETTTTTTQESTPTPTRTRMRKD
jgi:hypothetical protein